GLNAQWLGRNHVNHGSISSLDGLWLLLNNLSGTAIHLGLNLVELACDVGSVAINNWRIPVADLTRVVEHDNLGQEPVNSCWGVVLGVSSHVTTADIRVGNTLDVESNVVSWHGLSQSFVVHFNGLDFRLDLRRSEQNFHTSLEDSRLDTTNWNRSDTSDL